jgi:Family of unknown function (DUF5678)
MPATVIDLRTYAGRWIAQTPDGEVVADAPTYHELVAKLRDKGVDVHRVGITEVPDKDGVLLL